MLKISFEQGTKDELDEKIFIETNGKYLFTIVDLFNLTRMIADNERIINREAIFKTDKFFFKDAIIDCIDSVDSLEKICNKYHFPEKTINQAIEIDKNNIKKNNNGNLDKWMNNNDK